MKVSPDTKNHARGEVSARSTNESIKVPTTEALLGVPVHAANCELATATVVQWLTQRSRPARSIVQANALTLVNGAEDSLYRDIVADASLSLPDGMPLVWLLRLKGHRHVERVYGPDLMLMLCDRAAREGWKCYFYGGNPGVPEKLKEVLVARFPALKIVGIQSPPFRTLSPEEDLSACAQINASKPDILWVGLGSPKQDIWIHEHRDKLDVSVMHGVGAAFDFLSGELPQAPRWMMNSGLEWLFRLMVEPRRLWKRYTVVNLKFLYLVARELFGG
jgi:N-acetylglucosaminyldiphosphoundecaprenol N-acetyl-beta-D-mannosaminyltransferase